MNDYDDCELVNLLVGILSIQLNLLKNEPL